MSEHTNPIRARLAAALAQRHWEPAVLAQATGVPEALVREHLAGAVPVTRAVVQRYSAALGRDAAHLLAEAAQAGVVEDEAAPPLEAVARLLHEAWPHATPAERRQLMASLRAIREQGERHGREQ